VNRTTAILAAALVLPLSACGSNSLFQRDRPDEMAVSRQAPLVVPPDFSLVPPAPGAARTGTDTTAEQTLQALFGGPSQRSATETQVLDEAKGATADAGIRSEVGSPDTHVVDKGTATRDILAAPEGDGRDASASVPGT